jgi:hypothetical protein
MSLSASVQMLTSGFASLVAGLIISRNAAGQIEHFNVVGYIAAACGLLSVWLASRLRVAHAPAAPMREQEEERAA